MTESNLSDSEVSFEFEEDGYDSDEDFGSNGNSTIATEYTVDNSFKNFTKFAYCSFSIQSFIADKIIVKAEELRSRFLPQFLVDELLILLQHKNWLKLEVLSAYYEDWPKLRDACGLAVDRGVQNVFRKRRKFTCNVCFDTGYLTVFSLLCGHEFCSPCYQAYVEKATYQDGMLTCIDPQCRMTMLHIDIVNLLKALAEQKLLSEEIQKLTTDSDDLYVSNSAEEGATDVILSPTAKTAPSIFQVSADLFFDIVNFNGQSNKYNEGNTTLSDDYPFIDSPALILAVRLSIDSNFKTFKWCPANDCTEVVRLEDPVLYSEVNFSNSQKLSLIPIVTCHNSHEFCFNCQFENHLPVPCKLAECWIKKCSDDSETLNWLQVHTQCCPKCETCIEKNGGCNHITCRKCHFEFCWICLGDWIDHGSSNWHCNRTTKEAGENKVLKAKHGKLLARYLHHYKRFAAHQQSMSADYKTLDNIHKHVKYCMESRHYAKKEDITWNDVQFFTDAFKALCAGRKTLMWSHALAFFLSQNNFLEIFESMQGFLTSSVEKLSYQFENFLKKNSTPEQTKISIDEKREKFSSLAALVTHRRLVLVKHADVSIENGHMVLQEAMP